MADLASVNALIDSLANRSQKFTWDKTPIISSVNLGDKISWWLATGFPTAGVGAGLTAVIPVSTTQGSLVKFTNPGGGSVARLQSMYTTVQNNLSVMVLFDRLVHMSGLSGTDTAVKTINTPALNRGNTNGIGVVGFVEGYTNLGATPQTLTVSYTNTAGTAGRTGTAAIPATFRQGRLIDIVLQTGDLGIKSIETVQLSGSTGTAGNYGITLARPIADSLTANVNKTKVRSGLVFGYPVIEPDACLWLVSECLSGSTGVGAGGFTLFTTG